MRFRHPLTITYENPKERVLFSKTRDCNPFFHLYESIWMLDGRRDVKSLTEFIPRMAEYSDDGEKFHGAYGFRWRHNFDMDQIEELIYALKRDPQSRRVVLQMWDCVLDLHGGETAHKDLPCNLMCTFEIDYDGCLNMTVFNRSNDIIWGMLGANIIHFSVLQEYVATRLEVPVGMMSQVSSNAHIYLNNQWDKISKDDNFYDYYEDFTEFTPISPKVDEELKELVNDPFTLQDCEDPFLNTVNKACVAWKYHKKRDYPMAQRMVASIKDEAWKSVCYVWLTKRERLYNADK